MVIDESIAKAALKKQYKILERIKNEKNASSYDHCRAKKSRKAWIRDQIDFLDTAAVIINVRSVDNESLVSCLIPLDGKFFIKAFHINSKKCEMEESMMGILFTEHFLVRSMQHRKETQLKKMQHYFSAVFDAIVDNKTILLDNDEYDIFVKDVGLIICRITDDDVIVKTVIDQSTLYGRRLAIYEKMIGFGHSTNIKKVRQERRALQDRTSSV